VKVAGVSATYPVIRSRRTNLSASGAFDVYSSIVDVSSSSGGTTRQSESELRVVRLGLDANMRDAWSGITFGNVRVHRGLDWLNATGPGDQPAARPGAAAEFTKATGEVARLQALYATEEWTFNLLVSAGGQWTNDVLAPSEKFFFGGERNGRGFFSGQLTGDRAWATTVELQANTFVPFSRDASGKAWGSPAQFYAYFDAGSAYNIGPGDIRSTRLRSIGVGGRFDMNEWLGLELEGAQRLTRQVEGANTAPISSYEFYWRVTARF